MLRTLSIALLLVGTWGCKKKSPGTAVQVPDPQDSVAQTNIPVPAAKPEPTSIPDVSQATKRKRGTLAHINLSPIRTWVLHGDTGISRIIVAGHADGPCCARVSKAMHTATQGRERAWVTYGFADFPVWSEDRAAAELLVERLTELKTDPNCAGQLFVVESTSSEWEEQSLEHLRLATLAAQKAKELEVPLLVEVDVPLSHPPLLLNPLTESGAPLELTIPKSLLQMPDLSRHLNVTGAAGHVRELEEHAKDLQTLVDVQEEIRSGEGPFLNIEQEYSWEGKSYTNWQYSAALERKLTASIEHLQELRRQSLKLLRLQKAMRYLGYDADSGLTRDFLRSVEDGLEVNNHAKKTMRHLKAGTLWSGNFSIVVATPVKKIDPNFLSIIDRIAQLDLSDVKHELEIALRAYREVADVLAFVHDNGAAVLLDAFLRGWPATFSDETYANEYDQWLREKHTVVWDYIEKQLRQRGITLKSGSDKSLQAGALHRSNVVFVVKSSGSVFRVRPYFITHGSAFVVADPGARLVRYESKTADQNLAPARSY